MINVKDLKDLKNTKKDKMAELRRLATLDITELATECQTNLSTGEKEEIALQKLEENGRNEIRAHKPHAWYQILWGGFKDPFVLVLIALAVVSQLTGDVDATIVMSIMVFLSVGIRFIQEVRSQKASLALKEMIENKCAVIRDGVQKEIPMTEVVVGDIVVLGTGDMIPADGRLIEAKDLFLNQASLTGESMPIEKRVALETKTAKVSPLSYENLTFMGTDVLSGQGKVIILKTGQETYFGDIADKATQKRAATAFDKGMNSVSLLLIRLMAFLVPVIFVINGVMKNDWLGAFFFAIAVAVGLTPEMLPMIVTSNLAKGSLTLSKQKVIVKELNTIQNLGSMTVLCTDKTGTLTQDKVVLMKVVSPFGHESERTLSLGFLNANYQTGWKNLMDRAIITFHNMKEGQETPIAQKIDEIPFDFNRRRLTVVVSQENHQWMVTKGAVEEMLEIVSQVEMDDGSIIPVTEELKQQMMQVNRMLNTGGMRVIAVAYKKDAHQKSVYGLKDEQDMIMAGFMGFLDPIKPSAAEAIEALHQHDVDVKILTGDNEVVAQKVGREVGLKYDDHYVLGSDIDAMSESELHEASLVTSIFAKLNPMQKARIIENLQHYGETVGFMGDGINDAPALRTADVGISVDSAADITKEASSIILLEKSLLVLENGMVEGRRVFSNMMKYIKITLSSNFGNSFSVLIASIFLPFLPMLSLQLLVQNLIYSFSQMTIPWDKVDESELLKPTGWDTKEMMRFTLTMGPLSSLFDIITFIVMWFGFHVNTTAQQGVFQTGWFVVGLFTQSIVFHVFRTKKIPILQSNASWQVYLSTLFVIITGLFMVLGPFRVAFEFTEMPIMYWPVMVLIVLAYLLLAQLLKTKITHLIRTR